MKALYRPVHMTARAGHLDIPGLLAYARGEVDYVELYDTPGLYRGYVHAAPDSQVSVRKRGKSTTEIREGNVPLDAAIYGRWTDTAKYRWNAA